MTKLLTQNSELRKDRVWNWTLPAWVTKLDDGRTINVCPSAGACAKFCYARNGTYLFSNVKNKHQSNLKMVLDDLESWETAMKLELSSWKFMPSGNPRLPHLIDALEPDEYARWWLENGGAAVRIHDSGDFFSRDYLEAWLRIARDNPLIFFYAYTKEVEMFREAVEGKAPRNFRWIYSMGGKQDHLVDKDRERHADVFLSPEQMAAQGYIDQSESDLLAALLPTTRIGIPANNIVHFKKKMDGRTFAELESELHRHGKVNA